MWLDHQQEALWQVSHLPALTEKLSRSCLHLVLDVGSHQEGQRRPLIGGFPGVALGSARATMGMVLLESRAHHVCLAVGVSCGLDNGVLFDSLLSAGSECAPGVRRRLGAALHKQLERVLPQDAHLK